MKKIILTITLIGISFGNSAQNVDLNNSTDYIRINKNGESGFSRAFGLNSSNHMYIGSVEKAIGNIYFFNKGTGVLTTLKPNGNMGIGTTNPSAKLQVEYLGEGAIISKAKNNGTHGAANIIVDAASNYPGRFLFRENGSNKGWLSYSQGKFNLKNNNNTSLFTVKSDNGNIGIGTTNPTTKLFIKQNLDNNNGGLSISDTSGRLIQIYGEGTSGRQVIRTSGTLNPLAFDLYGSEKMRIKANGNVGIGSTNPDEKLTVNGKIHSKEVRVDLSIPADYVFQKYYTGNSILKGSYKMPTLEEVEAFTKKNHHLPEVPSATQIQKEGLHLKQMTNLLLQKIEELTLYTIEQEKRIKALESKL